MFRRIRSWDASSIGPAIIGGSGRVPSERAIISQTEAAVSTARGAGPPTPARTWTTTLFEPVPIAPLVYFRAVFGAMMVWEAWRFLHHDWVRLLYIDPVFYFSYYGFGWVRPWPGQGMYAHFIGLLALAVLIAIGACYRVAAALFFLAFTYIFLICKSTYLNHLYLVCLVSFLMIFVPAHRTGSVDAWLRPSLRGQVAPAWSLWLLRAQIGLVYVYGGIAKLDGDWLGGEPMRTWLARRADGPWIGPWLTQEWVVYGFSHGGVLFDLLVVPMLLWGRTRALAVVGLVFFHLTNAYLFQIGIFPWFMLAATPLFLPPTTLGRLVGRTGPVPPPALPGGSARARRVTIALLGAYFLAQCLIPLRHHLYPGNVNWTEEGHDFSWHMKLRDKLGVTRFVVFDPVLGQSIVINPADHLTPRQLRKMSTRPHMIIQFAHMLDERLREGGIHGARIHAVASASLNGRPWQPLVFPSVDLAAEPINLWPARWIVPLADEPSGEGPMAGPADRIAPGTDKGAGSGLDQAESDAAERDVSSAGRR